MPFDLAHEYLRHEVQVGEPHLFELLSRQSRLQGRRDPRRGVEFAELALATVEGSAPILGDPADALRSLALDRIADARRLAAIAETEGQKKTPSGGGTVALRNDPETDIHAWRAVEN